MHWYWVGEGFLLMLPLVNLYESVTEGTWFSAIDKWLEAVDWQTPLDGGWGLHCWCGAGQKDSIAIKPRRDPHKYQYNVILRCILLIAHCPLHITCCPLLLPLLLWCRGRPQLSFLVRMLVHKEFLEKESRQGYCRLQPISVQEQGLLAIREKSDTADVMLSGWSNGECSP